MRVCRRILRQHRHATEVLERSLAVGQHGEVADRCLGRSSAPVTSGVQVYVVPHSDASPVVTSGAVCAAYMLPLAVLRRNA